MLDMEVLRLDIAYQTPKSESTASPLRAVDSDLGKMHKSEHILPFFRIGRFVGESWSKMNESSNATV